MLKPLLLALLLSAPGAAFAGTADQVDQAITDNLGDPADFLNAFASIQEATSSNDAAALADWVLFPISVRMGKQAVTLHDASEFVAAYPDLFTDNIKAAITGQKYQNLFVNYQGVMFGDGQIWVAGICKTKACEAVDWRIMTIQEASK